MHIQHAFHNLIAQGTMVFFIITIPYQVERIKIPKIMIKHTYIGKH